MTGAVGVASLTGSITAAIIGLALIGAGFALYRLAPRLGRRDR